MDARALLKARLFDMFVGDWDRHIGQWDWIRVKGQDKWQPMPTDRDQAFAKFDGLVLAAARVQPAPVRELRGGVSRDRGARAGTAASSTAATWPSWTGRSSRRSRWSCSGSLTDAAIEKAARRMPAPYYRINGAQTVARS